MQITLDLFPEAEAGAQSASAVHSTPKLLPNGETESISKTPVSDLGFLRVKSFPRGRLPTVNQ
jgi:hypothetical protein